MSATPPREIGTLVVVILKAQHLPNKQRIGKQDPYCCVTLDGVKRRTRAIKRGGQHCEWDEEVRFTLYEDVEDILASTSSSSVASEGAGSTGTGTGTPPPLPPKAEKRRKKVRGGNGMLVACYADDPKEPEIIGETVVDLTEVLTKGETDEWFTLQHKDKFSGEVYLELTFWSNEKPPEKKGKSRPIKANRQYGGPGSFVPSDSDSSFGSVDSRNSIPNSLRTTSSLAQLDLYNPPYERTIRSQGTGASLDQIADEFGGLSVNPGSGGRRRESYPPPRSGHTPRPADSMHSSFSSVHSYHSNGYVSEGYSESGASYGYENPTTPVPLNHPHHRHSFGEPAQQFPAYQSTYDPAPGRYSPSRTPLQSEYASSMYSVPTSSSGFSSVSTPTASGFSMSGAAPASSGFMAPGTHTPASSGFAQHPPHTPVQYGYGPPPTHTPAPSGFLPPSSSMGYHQQPAPIQTYPAYQHYPPQSTSAPPMMYQPGPPSSIPTPPPHSAPPHQQQYAPVPTPSPSHSHSHMTPQQYPTYAPSTPSPPQQYNPPPPPSVQPVQGAGPGSRPLPMPGRPNGSYPVTPPHVPMPPPQQQHGASPTHPGQMVFSNTPPHMQNQPQQPQQQQSHPLPTPPGPPSQPPATAGPPPAMQQPNGFVPPPPPPPINGSRLPGPPPAPPSQMYQQQQNGSGLDVGNGRGNSPVRPPLPQPPVGVTSNPGGFQPPPMPPPLPARRAVSTSQHSFPQPPSAMPLRSVRPGEIYNPGPPPRPPAQMVYDGNTGFWNAPQTQ